MRKITAKGEEVYRSIDGEDEAVGNAAEITVRLLAIQLLWAQKYIKMSSKTDSIYLKLMRK